MKQKMIFVLVMLIVSMMIYPDIRQFKLKRSKLLQLPDFTIRVAVIPSPAKTPSLVLLVVKNIGNTPAYRDTYAKMITYYYDTQKSPQGFVQMSVDTINIGLDGLKPGKQFTKSVNYNFNKPGLWKISAYINVKNNQCEISKSNNHFNHEFNIPGE